MAVSTYNQYYLLNALFNFSRAIYISTYSLYLINILRLPVSWTVWLLVADLGFSTLAELPTGAFADIHGRKTSFVLACFISTLGYVIYAAPGFISLSPLSTFSFALIAEAILAVGLAFYSGALDAWIIAHPHNPHSLTLHELFSRSHAIKNVLYVLGGVLGVIIFAFSSDAMPGTYCASAFFSAALTVLAYWSMAPDATVQKAIGDTTFAASLRDVLGHIMKAVGTAISDRRISALIVCAATAVLLLQMIVVYWPYYLSLLPQAPTHSRTTYITLAFAWIAAYSSRAIGNWLAGLRVAARHPYSALGFSVIVNSIPVLVLCLLPRFFFPTTSSLFLTIPVMLYALIRCGEGAGDSLRPALLNAFIQRETARATILSAANSVGLLGTSLGLMGVSIALTRDVSLLSVLSAVAIVNLLTIVLYPRMKGVF